MKNNKYRIIQKKDRFYPQFLAEFKDNWLNVYIIGKPKHYQKWVSTEYFTADWSDISFKSIDEAKISIRNHCEYLQLPAFEIIPYNPEGRYDAMSKKTNCCGENVSDKDIKAGTMVVCPKCHKAVWLDGLE